MDRYQHTFQTWDKLAQLYQDKFMDLELYNDTYDEFCDLLSPNARVFEVGCGPGNITRYLLNKRPDLDIFAVDIAPSMLALAKQNVPRARFALMDCRDIGQVGGSFDAIVCGFCLPYLSKEDSRRFIDDCGGLLSSGDLLYISMLEGDYDQSANQNSSDGRHSMFVYYHETGYLNDFLAAAGFRTLQLVRKQYGEAGSPMSVHTIFIAEKR